MLVVETDGADVFANLAVEEFLLTQVARWEVILFLCRNRDAVVVGKNQNPWAECRVQRVTAEGAALARRVSGGGTVYHDRGNLNYGVLLPRAAYDAEAPFEVVERALAGLGIRYQRRGRTSLFSDDAKFSGTSFALRGGAALHHGTLLVESDLGRLRRMMEPPDVVAESHAVASVRAPVTNLRDVTAGLTTRRLAAALVGSAEETYGAVERRWRDADLARVPWKEHERRDRAWVLDRTPDFTLRWTGDPALATLALRVERGRVSAVTGAEGPNATAPAAALTGCPFDPAALARSLHENDADPIARALAHRLSRTWR